MSRPSGSRCGTREQRGIADGDRIRVFNDVGEFEAIAKVAAAVQPGEVIIYHAWEPYQFKDWKGCQEPVPAPWKALHLAGGYGQLHYRSIYWCRGTARGPRRWRSQRRARRAGLPSRGGAGASEPKMFHRAGAFVNRFGSASPLTSLEDSRDAR